MHPRQYRAKKSVPLGRSGASRSIRSESECLADGAMIGTATNDFATSSGSCATRPSMIATSSFLWAQFSARVRRFMRLVGIGSSTSRLPSMTPENQESA